MTASVICYFYQNPKTAIDPEEILDINLLDSNSHERNKSSSRIRYLKNSFRRINNFRPTSFMGDIWGKYLYETFCATWHYLYNLKNVKNTNKRVLLLVIIQASAFNFTKINTPPWVFFTFLKIFKRYRIMQSVSYTESKSAHLTVVYERSICSVDFVK